MDASRIQTYQQRLVEQLQEKNRISDQVAAAFRSIPRHPFVSHYYVHTPGSRTWTRYEHEDTVTWYETIYRDQNLVTRVDEHGRTLSSSSQPSIMASMLDDLQVKPGMRILEIGTGTGYNAALLATLTGDPQCVTSIDIDPEALEHARHALREVIGEGITVRESDGRQGYESNAPYDRIIVTASTMTISAAWLDQLAPSGLLVCVLQPPFAPLGGVLQARKHDTVLQGRIVRPASFMTLRDDLYRKRTIQIDRSADCVASFDLDTTFFDPHLLRDNPHFAFFLYATLPDLSVFELLKEGQTVFYQEQTPQGYIVFGASSVELRGERVVARRLWKHLVTLYSLWLHCQQPIILDYHFEMTHVEDQALFLKRDGYQIWPFERPHF